MAAQTGTAHSIGRYTPDKKGAFKGGAKAAHCCIISALYGVFHMCSEPPETCPVPGTMALVRVVHPCTLSVLQRGMQRADNLKMTNIPCQISPPRPH